MAKDVAQARIAVVGAGLMGHGIAQVFALAGHDVTITDTVMKNLDSVTKRIAANLRDLGDDPLAIARVRPCLDLAEAVREADYVVEAVLEDLPLKQKLFAEHRTSRAGRRDPGQQHVGHTDHLDHGGIEKPRARARHALVEPAVPGAAGRSDRDAMDLAEVVAWTMELHRDAGKKPAHVKKDVPGFIGNRLQHALWREAISLVENGICDAATVDAVIKASFGRRLAVLGPLENADLVGTDLTLAIHNTVLPAIDSRPAAVALSAKASGGRQARLQIGRRLSQVERRRASGAARQSGRALEGVA